MSSDKMETEEATPEAEPVSTEVPSADAPASSSAATKGSKKRPRSPSEGDGGTGSGNGASSASVTAASAAAAAQLSTTMGWNGLYSLLSATAMASNASLPTVDQVQQAALKSIADCPPLVHLSKTDSAPQLKLVDDRRLHVKGGMRGYRMSRATHGISQGHYYYEVVILEPPSASEIASALPSNARMGPKLQEQMKQALQEEKDCKPNSTSFGGHVRLGYSMRTGDLQAPVGYDKWSFAIRDIGGSKIHCSKREDSWGGEGFVPGDVVGCAISLMPQESSSTPPDSSTGANDTAGVVGSTSMAASGPDTSNCGGTSGNSHNQIRFFKNGLPMGHFVISKGKREGGIAFHIPDGVYYPAISLYMGAAVRFNAGPHFICPPRKLPTGLKLQPVSSLCDNPMTVENAVAKVQKEKPFRKSDMLQRFQELVQTEVQALQDSHTSHRRQHVQEVYQERKKRNVKTDDLENDEFYELPTDS